MVSRAQVTPAAAGLVSNTPAALGCGAHPAGFLLGAYSAKVNNHDTALTDVSVRSRRY